MNAKQLLISARALLVQDGWRQYGYGPIGPHEAPGPRCAFGALYSVMGRIDPDVYFLEHLFGVGHNLVMFNDDVGRTKEEVLAAFDTAITAVGEDVEL